MVAMLQGASVSSSSVVLHHLGGFNSSGSFNSSDSPLLLFDLNLGLVGFDFSVNTEDGSWVASTWLLSHLICAPLAGFLNDRIGRKRSLMIDTTLFGLGFIICATSHAIPYLILARLLLGAPLVSQVMGKRIFLTASLEVYVCEVVSPSRRGLAAALYTVLHSLGFCLMLLLGALVHWRLAMAVPALLSLLTMAAIHWLRESPAWLQRRGRRGEAIVAAAFYKLPLPEDGPNPQSVAHTDDPNKLRSPAERVKALLYTLVQPGSHFGHNFAFLAALFCLLGWCGFSILSFYAVEVFQLSGSPLSPAHTSWITRSALTTIVIIEYQLLSHVHILA
jgi:MFS family permease